MRLPGGFGSGLRREWAGWVEPNYRDVQFVGWVERSEAQQGGVAQKRYLLGFLRQPNLPECAIRNWMDSDLTGRPLALPTPELGREKHQH